MGQHTLYILLHNRFQECQPQWGFLHLFAIPTWPTGNQVGMLFKKTTKTNGTHKITVISGCVTGWAVSYRTSREDRIVYLSTVLILVLNNMRLCHFKVTLIIVFLGCSEKLYSPWANTNFRAAEFIFKELISLCWRRISCLLLNPPCPEMHAMRWINLKIVVKTNFVLKGFFQEYT